MTKIIDISHWNGILNYNKITDKVILKCTESTNYVDPTFKERKEVFRKQGNYYGCYHFFRDVDIEKQVDWFLSNVGVIDKDEVLILDFEINCSDPSGKCKKFLDLIKQKTGSTPYLYTNEARANQIENSYPWWIARYGTNDGTQQTPPTKDWTIWQYTSRGKDPNIVGFVDLNIIKNNMDIKDYTPYSQKDLRWAWKKVGFGNQYFASVGCYTTCLAMMANKRPDEVNEILKAKGGFDGNLINSKEAGKALGLEFNGKDVNINNEPQYSPSIKEVNYNRTGSKFSQHFVLRIIKPDGKKAIIDPWGGVERAINYYPFRSYRLFKK